MDFRRLGRICTGIVAGAVIITSVSAISLAVLIPRWGGATPYAIETGSMRPGLPPGTLAVVRPTPVEQIAGGSVVTYQLRSGDPTVVTHRVASVGIDTQGKYRFRTQGDANDATDPEPVRPVQLKGVLWYKVPYLGYANEYIQGGERRVVTVVAVSGLLLYATYMFTTAATRRPSRSGHDTGVSTT